MQTLFPLTNGMDVAREVRFYPDQPDHSIIPMKIKRLA